MLWLIRVYNKAAWDTAVLHFGYFPGVRSGVIWVSCHKHRGDTFCAVPFIINGSLCPLSQQD